MPSVSSTSGIANGRVYQLILRLQCALVWAAAQHTCGRHGREHERRWTGSIWTRRLSSAGSIPILVTVNSDPAKSAVPAGDAPQLVAPSCPQRQLGGFRGQSLRRRTAWPGERGASIRASIRALIRASISQESERGISQESESGISQESGRGISQESERGISQESGRGISKESERGISQESGRGISQESERGISQESGARGIHLSRRCTSGFPVSRWRHQPRPALQPSLRRRRTAETESGNIASSDSGNGGAKERFTQEGIYACMTRV